MKTVLVTSEITYCPQNYTQALEAILKYSREHIAGLIIIKIGLFRVYKNIAYLRFAGCNNMQRTLLENISESRSKQKELLFKNHNIPVIYAKDINDDDVISWLKQTENDLIINMRTRCIYKKSVLRIPRLGCLNVHHGILPEQRGLFCDLYALADNRKAGFTIHKMTEQIDGGQIFYQKTFEKDKSYISYLEEVSSKEGAAVANLINEVAQKGVLPAGKPNICNNPVVTTTPNFRTIKQLKRKGMTL